MKKDKNINVRMGVLMHEKIIYLAKERDISASEFIRNIMELVIKNA